MVAYFALLSGARRLFSVKYKFEIRKYYLKVSISQERLKISR